MPHALDRSDPCDIGSAPTPVRQLSHIGGLWVQARSGKWIERRNPARRAEVATLVTALSGAEATTAIDAAVAAGTAWRSQGPLLRGEVLQRAATLLRDRSEELSSTITLEMGKTRAEALAEVGASADLLAFYGALGRGAWGSQLPDARTGTRASTTREPVGTILAITPWNDPLLTPARKLGPALVAGNTVVLKPSELTARVAALLVTALAEAGSPDGVVNVVTGDVGDLSGALVDDPRIAAITFTGSTAVGLELQRRVAGRNLRLQTEMGGKNAVVVLSDANLDRAADAIVAGAFGQAGQRCTATSRLVVEAPVHGELTERVIERTRALIIGPGDCDGVSMGPLVSQAQLDRCCTGVHRAIEQGCRPLCGGPEPLPDLDGHFVAATVLAQATPEMDIWRDELFAPVLACVSARDLHHAIELVNDSPYGLSCGLHTASLDAAERFAYDADCGQVAINLPTSGWPAHHPFGGFRLSGSAHKEQGVVGLDFYTRWKTTAQAVALER